MNDVLLQYLIAGKDPAHVANLNPELASRLAAMLADAPGGISIKSGYRSVERQQQLWDEALRKYGDPEIADNWVARPGKSRHNHGLAVDLAYADDAAKAWVHENARRYGLTFPLSWEDWHIQMIPDGQGGATPVAVADNTGGTAAPADMAAMLAPEGPVPVARRGLADMLAAGPAFSNRSRAPSAASVDVPEGTGNLRPTSDARMIALLDELQMALSRPAQSKRA